MQQKSSAQLTLGLSLKDDATFDNFYPGQNSEIVNLLRQAVLGQSERVIYLCSARGQGGSHLLQACCHAATQHHLTSVYLPLSHFASMTPEILSGFELLSLICIDELHLIAGNLAWEEAIFHLFNRMMDTGGRFIVAANALPKSLPFILPDLVSRLSWGMVYSLQPLLDEEKLQVLMMRAKRRGIVLTEEVGRYLLTHCPRHMGTLFAALAALDKASLAAQRRLTIPFVKEVLEI